MSSNTLFVSYLRAIDDQDQGRISSLVSKLEREIKINAIPLKVLFDKNDIEWGERWEKFLDGGPQDSSLFMPILVEGYFRSSACIREYRSFLSREKTLGRNDLILPIYYAHCEPYESEVDGVVRDIKEDAFSRNYLDWRDVRHVDHSDPRIGSMVENLSNRLAVVIRSRLPLDAPQRLPASTVSEAAVSVGPQNLRTEDPYSNEEEGGLSDLTDPEERRLFELLMEQSRTQKGILNFLYTKVQSHESLIADDLHQKCLQNGVISGECTSSEFIFRLKDLAHNELIDMQAVGPKTSTVKQSEIVSSALQNSGISKS